VVLSEVSERVTVGIVRRTRGVHGELVVESQTDLAGRFDGLRRVYLVTGDQVRPVHIERVRYQAGSEVWITLAEVTDREFAKTLRGATLEIDIQDRPELPEGVFYFDQIEGLEVYDLQMRHLGHVDTVYSRGGQDLYAVATPHGEVLVPATDAIVKKIDLENGRMIIDPPPGLMDPDDAY